MLLTFEKLTGLPGRLKAAWMKVGYRVLTLMAVVGGWVVFRCETLGKVYRYAKTLVGMGERGLHDTRLIFYLREYWIYWIVGILLCIPFRRGWRRFYTKYAGLQKVWDVLKPILLTGLFGIAISYLIVSDYNPFIYFNF